MTKRKREHFAEFSSFPHTFEPSMHDIQTDSFSLKGKWNNDFFKNTNPIVLELGCGKGEYTVQLAERYPEKNFIGIDIKGARMWRGAKDSLEKGLKNVAFLRSRIDWIECFFGKQEVDEIWITFPDPYLRNCKARKRLTSPVFLERYKNILKAGNRIHLKTDSSELYEYTLEVIEQTACTLISKSDDINRDFPDNELLAIQTYYENLWRAQGKKINYICFALNP